MYGYDAYGYDPATEGLRDSVGSFFSTVGEKIRKFAEWLKQKMKDIALKIRRMTGTTTADEVKSDSKEVTNKIKEIGENISDILDDCCTCIDHLYIAWQDVGAYEKGKLESGSRAASMTTGLKKGGSHSASSELSDGTHLNTRVENDSNGNKNFTTALAARGGMDRLDANAKNDSAKMAKWNKTKEDLGKLFAKQGGAATKVSADLKSLSSYGPLTLTATKAGYDELRGIFDANGSFGNRWKKVKIAAEWATGDIKAALNKVVSMYDVGVRATNAFGNRLSSGNFRGDDGKKMDKTDVKQTKSEYKDINKIYKHNKSRNDISTSRKDENFYERQAGSNLYGRGTNGSTRISNESVDVLDRIYQMAYEDAMNDIEESAYALEAYENVPGAYEFVDAYDSEYGYDPSLDPELY